ncbi:MAG: Spy/CpxP family protein refolding chaperone [Gammaproteobacteria bacterium]|nr:Spy/CpxP family protein refolding chaperone [Gammaproteobacteria bacterium]
MKRNHRIIIAAAALSGLLAAGTGSALAFGPGGGCDRMGMTGQGALGAMGTMGAVYRLDDLTAEQKTKLRALRDQARKQQAAWREDRQALHDAFLDGADAKALRPLAEKQGRNVTEGIMLRAEHRAAINAILTDAQRAQLRDIAAQGPRSGARPCMGRW